MYDRCALVEFKRLVSAWAFCNTPYFLHSVLHKVASTLLICLGLSVCSICPCYVDCSEESGLLMCSLALCKSVYACVCSRCWAVPTRASTKTGMFPFSEQLFCLAV